MFTLNFRVQGTHCPSCKRLIERRVGGISGITSVDVSFETGETQVSANREVKKEEIEKVLEGMEYKVL